MATRSHLEKLLNLPGCRKFYWTLLRPEGGLREKTFEHEAGSVRDLWRHSDFDPRAGTKQD